MTYREAPEVEETPFDPYLEEGEEVLFVAKARRGVIFRRSDALLIPFSLFWAGFAVFWTVGASSAGGLFGLFGVPFISVGAYMVFGRFVHDMLKRNGTTYGLTDQRLLIKSGSTLRSIPLDRVGDITLAERANGAGTVTLGKPSPWGGNLDWMNNQRNPQTGHLLDLPSDVRAFYRAILSARKRLLSGPTVRAPKVRVEDPAEPDVEVTVPAADADSRERER